MPIATANTSETTRFDLKSLEGGYVELRRMTYGQIVDRRAMMKLSVSGSKGNKDSIQGEMAMANREISRYEFRHCIVSHNLEKRVGEQTVPLNFQNDEDFVALDPRVGQEIEKLISDMNNFDEEDQEN